MDVLGCKNCAFLRGFATVTHIAPVTNLYQRVTSTMKLLHIDSSVLGPHSVSRQVSAAIVERLRKANPGLEVSYRDLTLTPLAHLSGPHLAAGQEAAPEPGLQADIVAGRTALEEFLTSDIVVIGAPMYNFTIPSQLKAWIDRILVAGKTFQYGAQGVEGPAGKQRDRNKLSGIRILRRRRRDASGFRHDGSPVSLVVKKLLSLKCPTAKAGVQCAFWLSANPPQVRKAGRQPTIDIIRTSDRLRN